tara:strand:- start:153 stop:1547 length:1395 start_codon:yes stop_codon:yes gene_type:complete
MADDPSIFSLDDYPNNVKTRNTFDQTSDSVSDSDSDMDWKIAREASLENFKKNYFKETKTFKAVVLRVDGDRSQKTLGTGTGDDPRDFIQVNARIPVLHPMIPKPKMIPPAPEDANKEKGIIEMHPSFMVRRDELDVEPGDVVLVEFQKGPGDGGQQQGGRIIKVEERARPFDGDRRQELARVFSGSPQLTLEEARAASTEAGVGGSGRQPDSPPAERDANRTFTFGELRAISQTGALDGLMDFISSGEGNINSFNRGTSGDSPGDITGPVHPLEWAYIENPEISKKLSELTIDEIRALQRGSRSPSRARVNMSQVGNRPSPPQEPQKQGIYAVGRFQMIPRTLKGALDNVTVPGNTIFDETTQKALCAYLLLMKPDRQSLGGYLVGTYEYAEWAGQDLAREWASQPIQFDEAGYRRGQTRYGEAEARHTPTEVVTVLQDARNKMLQNTIIRQILDTKGIVPQE